MNFTTRKGKYFSQLCTWAKTIYLTLYLLCLLQFMYKVSFRRNKVPSKLYCEEHVLMRSSSPEVFLGEGFLKIRSKFTGEDPCRSVILMKLQSNVFEITAKQRIWNHTSAWVLSYNLLHIFRTPFPKNPFGGLLLKIANIWLGPKLQKYGNVSKRFSVIALSHYCYCKI